MAVGIITDPEDPECPFSHDVPADDDPGKNELIGSGSVLAKALKNRTSTDLVAKPQPGVVENPRYVQNHPLHSPGSLVSASAETRANWPVTVTLAGGETKRLPVRCAAHHLIPAQEALKDSRLVQFMVHKDTPEDVKDGTKKGLLWRDVGYNVNGSENGVYLPGSYAVGGGRGGLRVWSTADEPDEEDEDLPENSADADTSAYLTGEPGSITASTPKWQYVKQAMLLAPGQFHDRHADYSREVQLKLDAVAANLAKQYRAREKLSCPCPECLKTRQKWAEKGYPPPATLVARLNGLSGRYRQYVNGSAWAMNLYTSKWCKAYMQARAAGHAWARI